MFTSVGRLVEIISIEFLQGIDRFGEGSIMVSAGIMYHNLMDLIIVASSLKAVHYIEDILEEHVVPATNGVEP